MTDLFLCMMATIARPSRQEVVKLFTLTPGYLCVVRLAHRSSASFAVTFSPWPITMSEICSGINTTVKQTTKLQGEKTVRFYAVSEHNTGIRFNQRIVLPKSTHVRSMCTANSTVHPEVEATASNDKILSNTSLK